MLDDILKSIVALAGLVGILFWGGLFLFHNWDLVLIIIGILFVVFLISIIYQNSKKT